MELPDPGSSLPPPRWHDAEEPVNDASLFIAPQAQLVGIQSEPKRRGTVMIKDTRFDDVRAGV
jgi:hypothetical protein